MEIALEPSGLDILRVLMASGMMEKVCPSCNAACEERSQSCGKCGHIFFRYISRGFRVMAGVFAIVISLGLLINFRNLAWWAILLGLANLGYFAYLSITGRA